jgi:hypothetical protein
VMGPWYATKARSRGVTSTATSSVAAGEGMPAGEDGDEEEKVETGASRAYDARMPSSVAVSTERWAFLLSAEAGRVVDELAKSPASSKRRGWLFKSSLARLGLDISAKISLGAV